MRRSFYALSLFALATGLSAASFKPAAQIEARGLYEGVVPGGTGGMAQSANVFLVPAVDLGGGKSLIPVLAYLLQGRGQELPEDGFYVQRHTFLAKPQFKMGVGSLGDLKAWGVAKRAINKETHGEAWSTGYYDWEEFGAGLGLDWHWAPVDKAAFGVEFGHRGYPNAHELAANLTRNRNYYTKDYYGTKVSVDVVGKRGGAWAWDLGLDNLVKAYTDNLYVTTAGPVTDDDSQQRLDNLLRFNSRLRWQAAPAWSLELALRADWNESNQNIWDGTSAPNRVVEQFYDYLAVGGGPSLTWSPQGPEGPVVVLGIDLMNRQYAGRPVRWRSGQYTSSMQADFEQDYTVDLSAPLPLPGLSVVGGFEYRNVSSNQTYLSRVQPTYEISTSSLGLKYKL